MKMNELEQIHKEFIHKDYRYYWQATGENKRLRKYQILGNIADYIVVAIDSCSYVYLLILMKSIVVALLEHSGPILTIFTKEELIKAVTYNYLFLVIYMTVVFMVFYMMWMKYKHRLMRYELCRFFKMLCIYYFLLISITCCLDFIMDTLLIILGTFLIRKLLLKFNDRVRSMSAYAIGNIQISSLKDSY